MNSKAEEYKRIIEKYEDMKGKICRIANRHNPVAARIDKDFISTINILEDTVDVYDIGKGGGWTSFPREFLEGGLDEEEIGEYGKGAKARELAEIKEKEELRTMIHREDVMRRLKILINEYGTDETK